MPDERRDKLVILNTDSYLQFFNNQCNAVLCREACWLIGIIDCFIIQPLADIADSKIHLQPQSSYIDYRVDQGFLGTVQIGKVDQFNDLNIVEGKGDFVATFVVNNTLIDTHGWPEGATGENVCSSRCFN